MLDRNTILNNTTHDITISQSKIYWLSKRFFDLSISLLLIPVFGFLFILLLILNKYYNPGSIFFIQKRMGKDCKSFNAIKFRSMLVANSIDRGHNDPLEYNRITPLGGILRKFRLDEIPQIINVIKGDMSLIGPRPDYYDHALIYLEKIKIYEFRHLIRPGISGLAQIRLGYAEGLEATKNKASVDIVYIQNAGFVLDLKIMIGTLLTIIRSSGN